MQLWFWHIKFFVGSSGLLICIVSKILISGHYGVLSNTARLPVVGNLSGLIVYHQAVFFTKLNGVAVNWDFFLAFYFCSLWSSLLFSAFLSFPCWHLLVPLMPSVRAFLLFCSTLLSWVVLFLIGQSLSLFCSLLWFDFSVFFVRRFQTCLLYCINDRTRSFCLSIFLFCHPILFDIA